MATSSVVSTGISGQNMGSSFGRSGGVANTRIERPAAIALRHLRQRHHLDPCRVAGGAELFEALAAEGAQSVHRRLEEFTRVEFVFGLDRGLPEGRRPPEPAVGIDIDPAAAPPAAADDLLDP